MSSAWTDSGPRWIGLDIGGANIKAAHVDGPALAIPLEGGKRPEELSRAVASVAGRIGRPCRTATGRVRRLPVCR